MNHEFAFQDYKFNLNFENITPRANSCALLKISNNKGAQVMAMAIIVLADSSNKEFLNLSVNYKEYFHSSNNKMSDSEVVVARTIDRILRSILQNITNSAITLSIYILKKDIWFDLSMLGIYAGLFAAKALFPINVGVISVALDKEQIKFLPDSHYDTFLILSANSKGIYSLEMNGIPEKNIEKLISKAARACQNFISMLRKIKSRFSALELNQLPLTDDEKKQLSAKNFDNFNAASDRYKVSQYLAEKDLRPDSDRSELTMREFSFGSAEIPNGIIFHRENTVVLAVLGQMGSSNYNGLNVVYNFPSFATGSLSGKTSNRREIGHSNLIKKALNFGVANLSRGLQITCEVLSADGSSSMASVNAASALLVREGFSQDQVFGLSFGLFRSENKSRIIVDMTALEDKFSEMDFKIAGTLNGFTAIQMDSKSYCEHEVLKKVLSLAKEKIKFMHEKLAYEKQQFLLVSIDKDKVGSLIGKSRQNLNNIEFLTDSKINIQQSTSTTSAKAFGGNLSLVESFLNFYSPKNLQTGKTVAFITKSEVDGKILSYNKEEMRFDRNVCAKKDHIVLARVQQDGSYKLLTVAQDSKSIETSLLNNAEEKLDSNVDLMTASKKSVKKSVRKTVAKTAKNVESKKRNTKL